MGAKKSKHVADDNTAGADGTAAAGKSKGRRWSKKSKANKKQQQAEEPQSVPAVESKVDKQEATETPISKPDEVEPAVNATSADTQDIEPPLTVATASSSSSQPPPAAESSTR